VCVCVCVCVCVNKKRDLSRKCGDEIKVLPLRLILSLALSAGACLFPLHLIDKFHFIQE